MKIRFFSVALILLLLGCIIYFFDLIKNIKQLLNYRKCGEEAIGIITKCEIFKLKSGVKKTIQIKYFNEQQNELQAEIDEICSIGSFNTAIDKYKNGEMVNIIINPKNPNKYIISDQLTPSLIKYILLIPVCIIVSLLIIKISVFGIDIPFYS